MSYLVANPEDKFSREEAHMLSSKTSPRSVTNSDFKDYLKDKKNEPAHEIMALFVLRKFILQSSMRSHPVGLDV